MTAVRAKVNSSLSGGIQKPRGQQGGEGGQPKGHKRTREGGGGSPKGHVAKIIEYSSVKLLR